MGESVASGPAAGQLARANPTRHWDRRWILGLAIIASLCTTWLLLEFAGERATDVAAGHSSQFIPSREDFAVLADPARQLLHGVPSNGDPFYYNYPAVTFAAYAPLAILPDRVLYVAVRIVGAILVVLAILAWSGRDGLQEHWIWPLVLSPPVINMTRLGQFNAGLAFAALTSAVMAQRRDRGVLFGASLGVALVARPTNALPVAAGLLTSAALRQRRLLIPGIGIPALWFAVLATVSTRWDPRWASHVAGIASANALVGVPGLVRIWFGAKGVTVLLTVLSAACALATCFRHTRPLSSDLVAGFFAVSLLATHLGGPYVALFALPGLVRVVQRSGHGGIAWGTVVAYLLLAVGVSLPAGDLPGGSLVVQMLIRLFVLAPVILMAAVLSFLFLFSPPLRKRESARWEGR